MRDAGEIGGDHPADRQPVIVVGQVDQLPQPVQGAASLRLLQRVGQLGAAEDDRRAGLDGPAAGRDDDGLPGPGAHVDHDGAVVAGGPQPHRHRFQVGGLPYQHGDGIGQGRAGGDLAGLPVQGGGQPGPEAVLRFRTRAARRSAGPAGARRRRGRRRRGSAGRCLRPCPPGSAPGSGPCPSRPAVPLRGRGCRQRKTPHCDHAHQDPSR